MNPDLNDRATQIHLAGAAITVAVAAGFWAMVVQPQIERRAEAAALRGELDATERRTDQKTQDLRRIGREVQGRLVTLEASGRELQPVQELNTKIARLLDLAAANGVSVEVIEPGEAEAGDMFFHVPVRLEGTGSFEDCVDLLATLHRDHPDVKVVRMSMSAGRGAAPVPDIRLDVVWFAALPTHSAG